MNRFLRRRSPEPEAPDTWEQVLGSPVLHLVGALPIATVVHAPTKQPRFKHRT